MTGCGDRGEHLGRHRASARASTGTASRARTESTSSARCADDRLPSRTDVSAKRRNRSRTPNFVKGKVCRKCELLSPAAPPAQRGRCVAKLITCWKVGRFVQRIVGREAARPRSGSARRSRRRARRPDRSPVRGCERRAGLRRAPPRGRPRQARGRRRRSSAVERARDALPEQRPQVLVDVAVPAAVVDEPLVVRRIVDAA